MKNKINKILTRLAGPLDTYQKRNTFILTIILTGAFFVSFLVRFMQGEYAYAGVMLLLAAATAFFGFFFIKKGFDQIVALVILAFLVFVMIPSDFFEYDGNAGTGVPEIILVGVFVILCLRGIKRVIMMALHVAVTIAEYMVLLYMPEVFTYHPHDSNVSDSLIGVLFSLGGIFFMLWLQTGLLESETKRAVAETERAEELNRNQNRFFSSMSHEIRTPINSILGLNEIILRQEDTSDEVKRDARNIQGAGRMLLALVNDILDISKIEAGKMDIVPVNYQVGSLISEIVNMIWLKAEEKGLRLTVDVDPSIPAELFGDEVRIRQILINLLNNAVKYTGEGEVSLHMECEKADGDQVLMIMAVSDTGMGIKPEALPHLFDTFQRVDEEKNRNIEGTGLGLSIVKQLTELMGGEITVNSVYGQGSTFTVSLKQRVSNASGIGDINITGYMEGSSAERYECGFSAPDARVLFVDDNEMNLEVETRLLKETGMTIDTATSGKQGLELTLVNNYDVIFMDHLMPEMDGIECLLELRRQTGGMNSQVPVIVLTANAGSENRELYARSGFDDYLVKPVSGRQLEDILTKHLPAKKLRRLQGDRIEKQMNTAKGYQRKIPVAITASSMCDLPESVIEALNIDIIPFIVQTEDGVFRDTIDVGADELVDYMNSGEHSLKSNLPSQEEYESFFSDELKKAHHVIHIALTTGMSREYERATAAAKTFENVTVINSEALSSATGILVMTACWLASQNESYEKIIEEIEQVKKRIRCSFVVTRPEYMMRNGSISEKTVMFMKSLNLSPGLRIKNDRFGVGRIWSGSERRVFEKYIRYALPYSVIPDKNVIFVTHVGLSEEDREWIEAKIRKLFEFDHIIFQKASAAISVNCGPGTFGMLYMEKGSRTYNFGTYLNGENVSDEDELTEENESLSEAVDENVAEEAVAEADGEWYDEIAGIDGRTAVKNSGSEEALKTVLKLFYDSIVTKSAEIEGYYKSHDWRNFTIKVHALKSSARLIGAFSLGEQAERMENAGKAGDTDYIDREYDGFMQTYLKYKSLLSPVFEAESKDEEEALPVADKALMESVYETLSKAAESMDTQAIEDTFDEMKAYAIPDDEKEKFFALRDRFEQFDYDGMLVKIHQG